MKVTTALAFILIGLAATIGQILVLRELLTVFSGSELAVAVVGKRHVASAEIVELPDVPEVEPDGVGVLDPDHRDPLAGGMDAPHVVGVERQLDLLGGDLTAKAVDRVELNHRVGLHLFGVGMPEHFILKYPTRQGDRYLDPFDEGRPLTSMDCSTPGRPCRHCIVAPSWAGCMYTRDRRNSLNNG